MPCSDSASISRLQSAASPCDGAGVAERLKAADGAAPVAVPERTDAFAADEAGAGPRGGAIEPGGGVGAAVRAAGMAEGAVCLATPGARGAASVAAAVPAADTARASRGAVAGAAPPSRSAAALAAAGTN